MKNLPLIRRTAHALNGIRTGLQQERSLRTQAVFAALAMLALAVLRPALVWWAMVGIMVGLVLAAELINTALENLCDHLHPDEHPRIRVAKDCAAGAVLLLSIAALWVGLLMVFSVILD